MNIHNFKSAYKKYIMKSGIRPLLWGPKGIGKTEAVSQIAEELGFNFVVLNLGSVEDVGDVIGLQDRVYDKDGVAVATKHLRPTWFPTQPKNIIFLDEFNRMNKSLLQAMHSFLLTGKLHEHQLPPESYIIAAANPPDDNHIVSDTSDDALVGRFSHIALEPTVDEWITYSMQNGVDYRVTSFIQEFPEFLEPKSNPVDLSHIKTNRRGWGRFISPFIAMNPPEDIAFEVVRGLVGVTAATRFMTHIKHSTFRIRGKDILNQYQTVRNSVKDNFYNQLDLLSNASEELVREIKLTSEINKLQADNAAMFLLDIPIELSYNTIRNILSIGRDDINKTIGANKELIDLVTNKLDEISRK